MKNKILTKGLLAMTMISLVSGCSQQQEIPISDAQEVVSEPEEAFDHEREEAASGIDPTEIFDTLMNVQGDIYNIYTYDRSLITTVERYFPAYKNTPSVSAGDAALPSVSVNEVQTEDNVTLITGWIDSTKVQWHLIEDGMEHYQDVLDEALINADGKKEEQADLFLINGALAAKYCDADAGVTASMSELGIGKSELKQQYPFTQEMVTDRNGQQRGSAYEAPCGLFLYHRSIANEVLGTDNPVQVHAELGTWEQFAALGEKLAQKNYYLLSGYMDSYYAHLGERKEGWVSDKDELQIDPSLKSWAEETKLFCEQGYVHRMSEIYSPQWQEDIQTDSRVFGFFVNSHDIRQYLLTEIEGQPEAEASSVAESAQSEPEAGSASEAAQPAAEAAQPESEVQPASETDPASEAPTGDWAICQGPTPFCQGGSWLCAASASDNNVLNKEIIKTLTTDVNVMRRMAEDDGELINNQKAMEEVMKEESPLSALFCGQDYRRIFDRAAKELDVSSYGLYDGGINVSFIRSFLPYFNGEYDQSTALQQFYREVMEKYPDLLG